MKEQVTYENEQKYQKQLWEGGAEYGKRSEGKEVVRRRIGLKKDLLAIRISG